MPPSSHGSSASHAASARRRVRAALASACALLAMLLACAFREPEPEPAPQPPPAETPAEPVECARIEFIEVVKSERRLRARCAGGAVLAMTAALSREPAGPKRERGDQRVPEGLYRIAGAARPSRFHRYIPIDYPSLRDADRALAEGAIGDALYRRIAAAHAKGRMPPQDTPLGGWLGLHGEGPRWRGESPWHDWTDGCIALADADIDRIAALAPVGTPVEIRP